MANYTVQVRTICENLAGYQTPVGYKSLEHCIANAVPLIFEDYVPVFDKLYRLPLFTKILRHYYTREIGLETPALWQFKLNTKLAEIMPYYNQLYESETLSFNPFYDVDEWIDHQGSDNSDLSEGAIFTGKTDGTSGANDTTDFTSNVDTSSKSDTTGSTSGKSDNTTTTEGETTASGDSDTATNDTGQVTHSGSSSGTDSYTDKIQGTETTTTDTTHGLKVTDSSTSALEHGKKVTSSGSESLQHGLTTTQDSTSTTTIEQGTTKKGNDWTTQQDTPQGGLSGIRSENYLSAATHNDIDESGTLDETDTTTGKVTTKNSGTDETTTSGTSTNSGTDTTTVNGSKTNSGTDKVKTVLDYGDNRQNVHSGEFNEKTDGVDQTTSEGSVHVDHRDSSSTTGKSVFAGTDSGTSESHNTASGKTGTINKNIFVHSGTTGQTVRNENDLTRRILNQNQYIQHVAGKGNRGKSYSQMLMEYRDTMLNIDMMIIRELNDLFMGVW